MNKLQVQLIDESIPRKYRKRIFLKVERKSCWFIDSHIIFLLTRTLHWTFLYSEITCTHCRKVFHRLFPLLFLLNTEFWNNNCL